MKRSAQELRNRGCASDTDLQQLAFADDETLLGLLHSGTPVQRTAAATLLATRPVGKTAAFFTAALATLQTETRLYTRLALCSALQQGGPAAAQQMVPFLGKIGNNQYQTPPAHASQKKSYPLPRDIIARSLARMGTDALPALLAVLRQGTDVQVSEALDAVGFLLFYQPGPAPQTALKAVLGTLQRYPGNDLVLWKCAGCLCAFGDTQSTTLLQNLAAQVASPAVRAQAARSLRLLAKRDTKSGCPPVEQALKEAFQENT